MRLRLGVAVSSFGADRIGVKENLPIGKSGFDFARHIKIVIFYGLSERIRKKYPISRERYRNMSEQENFLGTQPIGKLLLKFSVPCVLSMLVSALYNIVDQVFIGQSACLYFIRPKQFRLAKEDFRFGAKNVWKVCQLGLSSLITQISIVVIIAVANNMIGVVGPASEYGADIPLAVIGIVMKVFGIVIAFSVGIAVGGQPIAGFNYGSRDFARVKKTYKLVLIANIVVGAVSMLLFELCPQAIVSIFGSESDLYNQYADLCFRIFLGGILLCCVQKSSSIFLQSVGKPVKATLLSVSRDVVFLVPLVVVFALRFGVEGMLWAAPCADILAFLLTVLLVVLEFRDMNRQAAKMQVLKEMPADAKSDAAC